MSHHIAPIPCKPWALNGLSDRLIVAHYETVYGAAVRALNEARRLLSAADIAEMPAHEIRSLKLEEARAAGSVALHELYFGSMGPGSSGYRGDGETPAAVAAAMDDSFGGMARWRRQFKALALALAGRPGWVVLAYSTADGRLDNRLAFDDCHAGFHSTPILALDMYEHAYVLEFGANAEAYVDAFLRNVDWAAVVRRLERAAQGRELSSAGPQETQLPSISAEELAARLAGNGRVQVVDARPRHYFSKAVDMMAGATWRDPERVDEWCGELSKDAPVAVYCAYGFHVGCGVTAALREQGFDARYILGGLSAWYGIGGARTLRPGAETPQR